MKYIGNFHSLSGVPYEVVITTNYNNSPSPDTGTTTTEATTTTTTTTTEPTDEPTTYIDLTGTSPFVTNMDNESEMLYTPIKGQGATVSIVNNGTTDFKFDLFSIYPTQTKVVLKRTDTNKVVWVGFADCQIYDNQYEGEHDILQLECVGGLSALKNIAYTPVGVEKGNVSMLDVMLNCLLKINCYSELNVSRAVKLTQSDNGNILEQLYINEGNFFKERKDEKQTDNELAFTCYDVIEAICRYMNYTAVADGDKLYLIDYDNIRNGNNQYTTYDLSGPTLSSTAVTIADNVTLQASMYQGSNNNISLDNVYSKVSVTDNLYTFDNALPELFNYQATNITAADDWTKEDRVFTGSGIDDWELQTVASGNTIQTADGLMNSITDRNYHTFMKYYHNQPNYKFYWYEKDAELWRNSHTLNQVWPTEGFNYSETTTNIGAVGAKMQVDEIDKWENGKVSKLDLNEYVEIVWQDLDSYGSGSNPDYDVDGYEDFPAYLPMMSTVTDTALPFGGENAYIIVQGSVVCMDREQYYITPTAQSESKTNYLNWTRAYLNCQLEWDGLYYNGHNWTETPTTFKLPYLERDKRVSIAEYMAKELPIRNTVTWDMGLDLQGYAIKLPNDRVFVTKPKFTIYNLFRNSHQYRMVSLWIKNFKLSTVIANPLFDENQDDNTLYTNVIDENIYDNEYTTDWNITTWDDKKPNLSSVMHKQDGKYYYVDKLYNSATNLVLRQEEQFIVKAVNQYNAAGKRLSLILTPVHPYTIATETLIDNIKLIVDNQSIDYQTDSAEIELREINPITNLPQ